MRRAVLLACIVACGKHAPHDEAPPPLDRTAIFPQLAPGRALPTGPVRRAQPGLDGLVVTLAARGSGAQAKLLTEADLAAANLPLDAAYAAALANLEDAAQRGEIPVHAEVGADGKPVDIVWGHDWRAAACVLLPGVAQQAHQQLGPTIYAVVPNRDALVLFADPAVAQKALAAEQGAPNKLSEQLYKVP
ncbi:MAG: hypothetical protein JO257_18815 [Deltaproteobacteria bacterium]|nr:hypothetical protein [Deltaproteobacteria bacterium]